MTGRMRGRLPLVILLLAALACRGAGAHGTGDRRHRADLVGLRGQRRCDFAYA